MLRAEIWHEIFFEGYAKRIKKKKLKTIPKTL